MQIEHKWDATALLGKRDYYHWVTQPPEPKPHFIPPNIAELDQVLVERSAFIDQKINRNHLINSIKASHDKRQAPTSTMRSIELLGHEQSFLVITGQQPGILGGPLLSLYKIIHAIVLAGKLNKERPETFIPAFWNASEDHDFLEISKIHWLNQDKQLKTFQWQFESNNKPYYDIPMADFPLEDMLQALTNSTHPTLHRDEKFELIESASQNASTYPDFFDAFLWNLFPDDGLIIIRPEEEYIRQASVPIIDKELNQPLFAAKSITQLGNELQSYGLTPQLHKRKDRTSFFIVDNSQRVSLEKQSDRFISGAGKTYTVTELKDLLYHDPVRFSPSAILRPIIQDAVLPTAASILGPSEMAYHFLLNDLYEQHTVPRPALVPRIGFTIIEPKIDKLLQKYQLSPLDMPHDPAFLAKSIVRNARRDSVDQKKDHCQLELEHLFEELKSTAVSIDPTIEPVLQKNLLKIQKIIIQSDDLIIRRQAQKDDQVLLHLHQLQDALFPNGAPQERVHSIIHYLMNYGPDIVNQLKEVASELSPGEHPFVLLK